MRINKTFTAAAIALLALGLSGCANSLTSTVSRYQAMPAPQGQSFYVVPGGGMANNGGLEFQRYAGIVAQQLQARGYTPATDPKNASMIVQFGYGVDHGQTRIAEDPFAASPMGFGGGWGGFGRGPWGYPRYGFGRGFGYPFAYGWDDPFWYGSGISSYVEYHSQIDLHIRAAGTNQPLFDGRAQARSETNRLDYVVPGLVEAMFAGFPGRSGETIKITIPTPRQPPA